MKRLLIIALLFAQNITAAIRDSSVLTDMYEVGNDLIIEVTLPGISNTNIQVTKQDNYINISATRLPEVQESRNYLLKQIHQGPILKTVKIPFPVEATMKKELIDGILKITLLKTAMPEKPHVMQGFRWTKKPPLGLEKYEKEEESSEEEED